LSKTSISAIANEAQEGTPELAYIDELPIVEKPSNPVAPEPPERINKYIYPEFAGLAGERYLLSLAEQFAPLALWRTWYAAVSFQAPGQCCYVGVGRITTRVGPKERKIYLDLQALEERGWLTMSRVRMPFLEDDGTIVYHPVTDKNFTGFYETAHDYHLWMQDKTHYIAPERENMPLILEDAELTKRLIKFENYRRLLLCAKPGRKPKEIREDYQSRLLAQMEQQRTPVQEVNIYFNESANTIAPYRIDQADSSNEEEDRSSFSTSEKGRALTIRKTQVETDTNSKPKPNPPIATGRTENSAAGEAVKDARRVMGYTEEELRRDNKKRGAAVAGIPADQYAKLTGGLDRAEQEERRQREQEAQEHQQSRPQRERPARVVEEVGTYARQYDEPERVQSAITRAVKTYVTAQQALDHFNDALYWSFYDEAKQAANKRAHKRNRKNGVNRVPYMLTCLENNFQFSLEELVFLRTEDPLYTDYGLWDVIDHLRISYQEQISSGQTRLDYRQWLGMLLDQLEHCKEPKARANRTTRDE
jgi:hypothetical protein